ncbi:MAG: hypothetical protein IT373_04735 [Polyangiaceae bacterium]|nr:hypothetical protein [Polyangiaceae bacterium]
MNTGPRKLLVIRHRGAGEPSDGHAVCDEIRKHTAGIGSRLVVFHDATEMTSATAGYALAFKRLDAALAPQVDLYVCAIPGMIPRMMAHTVAIVSPRDWRIFDAAAPALALLRERGFHLAAEPPGGGERVSLH